MSTEHEILMHSFNGTDFDDLYPKSKTNLIEDSKGKNLDELLGDFVIPKDITSTSIASFNDGIDGAILGKCIVDIEPIQAGSGDPSPTNVRSISGWTGAKVNVAGKNLIPLSIDTLKEINTLGYWTGNAYTDNGITFTPELDASGNIADIHISGVLESGISTLNIVADLTIKPGQYYLQIQKNPNQLAYIQFIQNERYIPYYASSVLTYSQEPSQKVYIRLVVDALREFDTKISFMMKEGADAATEYEPYKGNIYDISFPSEAGTVYGGTLDVGTGVLAVDRIYKIFDGSEDEAWVSTGVISLMLDNVLDNRYRLGESLYIYGISNIVPTLDSGRLDDNYCIASSANSTRLQVLAGRGFNLPDNQVSTWRAFLQDNPLQIAYKLAEPITYQLAPVQVRTLLGENNIYADCGDVTVQYRGDVPNLYEHMANAENKIELESKINKWRSNPDLLDNSYFVGGGSQLGGGRFPINQRGQTSYDSSGYVFDRWRKTFDHLTTIEQDCVTYNNTSSIDITGLAQRIENYACLSGKTLTFSALVRVNSGTFLLAFATKGDSINISSRGFTNSSYELVSFTINVQTDITNFYVFLASTPGSSFSCKAAKLELGDTQTLAHQDENGNWVLNEIPNYQEQLTRCQRYYIPESNSWAFGAYAEGASYCMEVPAIMRATPNLRSLTNKVYLGSWKDVTLIDVRRKATSILLTYTGSFTAPSTPIPLIFEKTPALDSNL